MEHCGLMAQPLSWVNSLAEAKGGLKGPVLSKAGKVDAGPPKVRALTGTGSGPRGPVCSPRSLKRTSAFVVLSFF